MKTFYARYECSKEGTLVEDLVAHLRNVGNLAFTIAEKILPDYKNSAKVAGNFHDLFKVVFTRVPDCQKEPEGRMSFAHHEVVSAVFLANYLTKVDLNLSDEEMKAAVKAVLLHHQGLRRISSGEFFNGYNRVMNSIRRKKFSKVLDDVKYLLSTLGYESIAEESMLKFETINEFLKERDEIKCEEERFVSGILMLADNYVSSKALGKQASRLLVIEISDYLKSIGINSSVLSNSKENK
ncbi:MAG: CRISPR-associated endonuclease Cas3'' [Thermoproteota archaeon]|jgi:CRISPR-associated endonuclease Cas3-HD